MAMSELQRMQTQAQTIQDRHRRHDPAEILRRMDLALQHLREHFIGRDAVLEQVFYAFLTREHLLIIGDRGLAKSRLARSVFAHFSDDIAPFSLQLTRSTSVGQLVGGLDLQEFERGTYVHNLDGYIVRAHFAFLDELFDANDFVLRALNGILNEREFLNGPQIEKAALHSAIATTNFIRDTRESRAVLDRLLFKSIVHRAEQTLAKFRIRQEFLTSHGGTVHPGPDQAVSYDELSFVSEIIHGENPLHTVSLSPHVLVLLDELISSYEKAMNEGHPDERFVFSDRTKNKAIHVLMASALRSGRQQVVTRDLAALHYLVPTIGNPQEEEVFDHALNAALKQFGPKDLESIDQAAAIIDIVQEVIQRHRAGTLDEVRWADKMKSKVGKILRRKEEKLTLGGLLEETRGLHADHSLVRHLKDEVVAVVRQAHDQHHIPYEQIIHS